MRIIIVNGAVPFIMVCILTVREGIAIDMFAGKVQKAEAAGKKCFLVFLNKDKIIC